jgi:hypothetical protein
MQKNSKPTYRELERMARAYRLLALHAYGDDENRLEEAYRDLLSDDPESLNP